MNRLRSNFASGISQTWANEPAGLRGTKRLMLGAARHVSRLSRHASRARLSVSSFEFTVAAVAILLLSGALDSIFAFDPQIEFAGPLGSYNDLYIIARRCILALAAVIAARDVKATAAVLFETWPIAIGLLWIMLSSLWSLDPWTTFIRSTVLISIVIMTAGLVSRHGTAGLLKPMRIAGIVVLVANLALLVFSPPFVFEEFEYGNVFRGTFLYKNVLAYFFTGFVICTLAEMSTAKNWAGQTKNVLLLVGSAILLVQCQSVTGMAMSLGALFIAAFLWLQQSLRLSRSFKVVSIGCILLIALAVAVLGRDAFLEGFSRDITLTGRTIVWELLWRSILDKPLLGFGYGSYWISQAGAEYYFGDSWIPPNAHNGFFDAQLGGGVVLFSLIILQTAMLITKGVRQLLASQSTTGWFVVLVAGLLPIYNLVESVYLRDYSVLTVLFLGAVFATEPAKTIEYGRRA